MTKEDYFIFKPDVICCDVCYNKGSRVCENCIHEGLLREVAP